MNNTKYIITINLDQESKQIVEKLRDKIPRFTLSAFVRNKLKQEQYK